MTSFLGQELEIHRYGRIDFDRIAIQKRWAVAPFADGFDSGTRQFGVDLGVDHAQRQRIALHSDNRMENHGPLDASGLGCRRIDRLYLVEKFWGLYIAAESNSRPLSRRSRQRLNTLRHLFVAECPPKSHVHQIVPANIEGIAGQNRKG